MRNLHIAVAVAVLLLLAARLPLAAQSILTTVVEAETGRPVTSSLVVLLDASGRQVAGAVTGVEGQVTLRAPAPGTYRLRTERVGFATTLSAPFELVDGQRLLQRVEVSAAAIMLDGLVARGTRRCVLRPEEGTQTQKVWEEARKALNATAWTEALGLVQYRNVGYTRELDDGTQRVRSEVVSPRSGEGGRPYQSLPAEELATHGYVKRDGDGWMHYAPDAEVLLSDIFQDSHCLRVQKGTREHEGRVGLAFEPMRGAKLPDVRGVLWLDAKSAELQMLEFQYTNLPQGYGGDRRSGGQVEFERLPNGVWIVRRWRIRADLPELHRSQWQGQLVQNMRITAIHEIGGEVVDVRVGNVAVGGGGARRAVLEGVVTYPRRPQLPEGTEVFLLGTPYRAPVDSLGRFRLADLPAGLYTASVAHPQLMELRVGVETREVALRPDDPARVELDFPSPEAVVEAACPNPRARSREARTGLVFGTVRESATGAPVANVRVGVTWPTFETRSARIVQVDRGEASTTDREGRFLICEVPLGVGAQLKVAERGVSARSVPVRLEEGPVLRQDLVVRGAETR